MFRVFFVLILALLVCAVTDTVTGADVPAPSPQAVHAAPYYAYPPAWYYAPPAYAAPPVYRVPVVPYYVYPPPRPRHHGPHDRHWLDLRAPGLRLGIGW